MNLLVIVKTASFPCVDKGSPVMRSRHKTDSGREGDRTGCINPFGGCLDGFASLQIGQLFT